MSDSTANNVAGDLSRPVATDTDSMEWSPSPSGTVWRKRVHLVGPPESGQVTSVVRYEPGATFPAHDHPEGEEIFVLDGVFSDEHGDWTAGTYLMNPEGFRHAPFSKEGCLIFVKLRQAPSTDRVHVAAQTHDMAWKPGEAAGLTMKPLYAQDGFSDVSRLEHWAAGSRAGARSYPGGAEIFVVEGSFSDTLGEHGKHSWLRLPAGAEHDPETAAGCTVFVKTGGLAYLKAG